ncbi:AbrB/MazE/SpoVT family DNA-binding domain-containing protein [Arvimicrobium flavum]|uniref:AbrB/MazE/SpoVT family DNA-binding domain-containing protein n=1 Tax=Arvimicrobium flavum TaxID=3393320 RepID=UPI00237B268D|nr:AbrB/MazE/SpoVT family DNA-binding domain-containing protein [Mesorhizobium shangrilense]
MRSALKKFGNSAGIIIPKPLLSELGAQAGDAVDVSVDGDCLVIRRVADAPRQGWAEDAAQLAAEGDDGLIWPEFPNEDDGALKW